MNQGFRRPWLRWLRVPVRFSMRTMFGAMLVAALFFAWFGWRLRKAQRQVRAIAVLQEVGAVYGYDFQGPIARPTNRWGSLAPAPGRSRYPRQLRKLLGVDFLHNVSRVHLETSQRLADADVKRLWTALGDLPDLVSLEASGPVTRPGVIRQLRNAQRLRRLALRWADIDDDDLAILDRTPRLEELNLNETPVTDAAMVHVGRSRSLQAIELHHTKVSNAGLREIAKVRQLQRLRLSATDAGGAGMRHLSNLKQLSDLDLEHTKITDQALGDVARLSQLQRLNLSLNSISEVGARRLVGLASLKELRLQSTRIGPEGLATLARLPVLESLYVDGPILSGDLSGFEKCASLRQLSIALGATDAAQRGLKLPLRLEEISGLQLSDETFFDALVSLPNLKVLNTHFSSYEPEEVNAVQRFRTARPGVQVVNR